MKIIQVTTALHVDQGNEIKRTLCVDELGHAWELHRDRWSPLPMLPKCTCANVQKDSNCVYHKAVSQ